MNQWFVQNPKGRTRPDKPAPDKPTLASFFPEGSFSQIEPNLTKDEALKQIHVQVRGLLARGQELIGAPGASVGKECPVPALDSLESLPEPTFKFGDLSQCNPSPITGPHFFGGPSGGM